LARVGGRAHAWMVAGPAAGLTRSPGLVQAAAGATDGLSCRSEEHTSELQSLTNLVCRLLLEKKKNQPQTRQWKSGETHAETVFKHRAPYLIAHNRRHGQVCVLRFVAAG